jgi:hypothetical protein
MATKRKAKTEDRSRPCKIMGCTRRFIPGKGCADGACGMHTRRFIRHGTYGGSEAQLMPTGERREILKVFVRPELKRQIEEIAEKLGVALSQWAEQALVKEAGLSMLQKKTA